MVYFGSQLKKHSPWWCRSHGSRNTRWMYYVCHQEKCRQKMGLPMEPERWLRWPLPLLPGRLYLLKQDHSIQKTASPTRDQIFKHISLSGTLQSSNCILASFCSVSVEVTYHFTEITEKKDVNRFFGHSRFLEFAYIPSRKVILFSNRKHAF